MKNYLEKIIDKSKKQIIPDSNYFEQQSSYVTNLIREYHETLSESIDIFSNVPDEFFDFEQPIANFLKIFKQEYYKMSRNFDLQKIIPKLNIQYEDDESIIIYWNSQLFRIFFSFEEKEEENSYGIVENNIEVGSFFTKNGLLKEKDYRLVIDEFIEYVLKNT